MLALLAFYLQPDPAMLQRLFEEGFNRRREQYGLSDARTAAAARDLGLFLREAGDRAQAHRRLSDALAIDERAAGKNAARTLEDAADLATVADPLEAETLLRRASSSPDAMVAARSLAALGELQEAVNNRFAAAALYRAALAKEEIASGKQSARVAVRLNALALVSEPPVAVPLLQRALDIDRRLLGEKHPETSTTEANLSGELLAMRRIGEAVRLGSLALAGFEATLGAEHPRTAGAASNLADAKRAAGNRAAAELLYRRALRIDEQALGRDHPETLNDVKNLAEFLREIGKVGEAAELEQRLTNAAGARR